ncbi:MAG TPA: hypothetical protein VJI33_04070 [Candidatus Paceibacterota bacterium]
MKDWEVTHVADFLKSSLFLENRKEVTMSAMVRERVRSAPKLTEKKNGDRVATLDVAKVKIVPLPRRNDDIYMRGLRRRRA